MTATSARALAMMAAALLLAAGSMPALGQPPTREQADKLLREGQRSYDDKLYPAARERGEKALKIYQALELKKEAADSMVLLGRAAYNLGDFAAARGYLELALADFLKLGLEHDAADALDRLSVVAARLGDEAKSRDLSSQAIEKRRKLGLEFLMGAGPAAGPTPGQATAPPAASPEEDRARAATPVNEPGVLNHQKNFVAAPAALQDARLPDLPTFGEAGRAHALWKEGVGYLFQKRYPAAREPLVQALGIYRKLGDDKSAASTASLLGGVTRGEADYRQAQSFYELALACYRRLGQVKETAGTLEELASVYLKQGELASARAYLGQALPIYRKLGLVSEVSKVQQQDSELAEFLRLPARWRQEQRETADALMSTGLSLGIHADLGDVMDLSEARSRFAQALVIYRRLGLQKEAANAVSFIGHVALQLGEAAESRTYIEEALASYRRLGMEAEAVVPLGDLATLSERLGRPAQSLAYYEQALDACRKSGGEQCGALVLANRAGLASSLGMFPEARAAFEEALAVFLKLHLQREAANTLFNLAGVSYTSGDLKDALSRYQQAAESFREQRLKNMEAVALCQRAVVAAELGWNLDALSLYSKDGGCDELLSGRAYFVNRQFSHALKTFQAVADEKDAPTAERRVAAHIGLALAEEKLGETARAEPHFREAISRMEEERASLPPGERQHYLSGKVNGFPRLEAYEGLVRVLHRLKNPALAFFWSEHTKARILTEAVARSASASQLGIPAALQQQELDLAIRIGARQKLLDSAVENQNATAQAALNTELMQLKEDQQALIAQLRRDHPEYAAVRYPQPLQASELALRAGEVLLAYEVTDTATLVFVVRAGKVEKAVELKVTRQELAEEVERYRAVFVQTGQSGAKSTLAGLDLNLGHRLWQQLLQEPLAGVAPDEKVLIVPDEMLSLLPFEALVEQQPPVEVKWEIGNEGPFPQGVHYVGDSRVLSYWQSASSMAVLRRLGKPASGEGVFAVADPIFDLEDPRLQGGPVAPARTSAEPPALGTRKMATDSREAPSGRQRSKRLASTAKMVAQLREIYGESLKGLMGAAASKSAVQREPLLPYGAAVVFATHGKVSGRAPDLQQAALVLSTPEVTGETGEGANGLLTMGDVMDLKMRTELAGALACETGLGADVSGEGVMNLGRALQYAGARSALISLWSVEDNSTNELAVRVLQGMKRGETKDAALLAARRTLRRQGYQHPFYWAGFILVGETDLWKK